MKVLEAPIELVTTEDFTEHTFGVQQRDLAHILNILRNQLYSDKPRAVVREYCCNAADSHAESGVQKPFCVNLPTSWNPVFSCRDFGPGLTEAEIAETYCMYGRSTKRNSNLSTGEKGIGSKAGFAYGDSFMVISRQGGVKTQYNAYIDPSRIGKIAKLLEEPSDEEPGIEIIVPVKPPDIEHFCRVANETLQWFSVTPIFQRDNKTFEPLGFAPKDGLRGTNWAAVDKNCSYAVMGNVGYPITVNSVQGIFPLLVKLLEQQSFRLQFANGDLHTAASREALEYDKTTQTALLARLNLLVAELRGQIEAEISKAPDLWSAKALLGTLVGEYPRCILSDKKGGLSIKWNGLEVVSAELQIPEGVTFERLTRDVNQVASLKIAPKRTKWGKTVEGSARCTESTVVAIRNGAKFGKQRAATLFAKDPKVIHLAILAFADQAAEDKFYLDNNFQHCTTVDLNSLDKGSIVRTKKAATAKTAICCSVVQTSCVLHNQERKLDKPALYYVEHRLREDSIKVGNGSLGYRGEVNALMKLPCMQGKEVIIIRPKHLKRIPADWVKLDDYLRTSILGAGTSEITVHNYLTSTQATTNKDPSCFERVIHSVGNQDHLLRKYYDLLRKCKVESREQECKRYITTLLFPNIANQVKKEDCELYRVEKRVKAIYPIFLHLYSNTYLDASMEQAVVQYINLVDNKKTYEQIPQH